MPLIACSCNTFGVPLLLRLFFQLRQPRRLDLLDLIAEEAEVRHLTLQLGPGVGRDRTAFRRAHARQILRCVAQFRVEPADAQSHQCRLHPVDAARALADELIMLTVRPFRIFLFDRRDLGHAAVLFSGANYYAERAGSVVYFPDEYRFPLRIIMSV